MIHPVVLLAEENNKCMKKNEKKKNESENIAYLEKNNLYFLALSQNLPTSGFKLVKTININEYFDEYYDENSEIVFYLKYDLKYLKHLG